MRFSTRSFVASFLALSLVSLSGCASETPEETTAESQENLNAGNIPGIICSFVDCDDDDNNAPRWVKLGEQEVGAFGNEDRFHISGDEGRFRQLQIRVRGGDVTIHDCDVEFRDGDRWSPDFDHSYDEGENDIAAIPGGPRRIRNIEFRYSTFFGGSATVEVWGRR